MRLWVAVIAGLVSGLAGTADVRAAEPSNVWKDGWTINLPGRSNWVSNGTPSPFDSSTFSSAAVAGFTPGTVKDPYGFADYSVGRTLGFARDYGLGNVQATVGVRMSESMAGVGFTPSVDSRRFLGIGPSVGLEGNKPLQPNWTMEWRVGAAMLSGGNTIDTNINPGSPALPNYTSSGSILNLDGLLGLSYWFDSASKLTVGYRADYFKGAPALNMTGTGADAGNHVDHGPMVQFSVQK